MVAPEPEPVGPAAATAPPVARRDGVVDVVHGVEVADPYRWLEDGDAADTRAWVAAQNGHTRTILDALPMRAGLGDRFAELFGAGTAGAPSIRGGRLFSLDRWGEHEQAVLVVRSVDGAAAPRTLLDPSTLTGDATTSLDWFAPSLDGGLIAFGTS